jgi:hypothetical protein
MKEPGLDNRHRDIKGLRLRYDIAMEKVVARDRKSWEASLSSAGPAYRLRVCLTILRPLIPLQTFSKVFPV